MDQQFPTITTGLAQPLNEQALLTDSRVEILTDSLQNIVVNREVELRYTNPDLHRRIDQEAVAPVGSDYKLVVYNKEGVPYRQTVRVGILDGMHSFRLTETYIHDEESETCEIP